MDMQKKDIPVVPLKTDSQGNSVIRGKNGGARPGAGRKPSSLTISTMKERRETFLEIAHENGDFEEICRSLISKAKHDSKLAVYVIDQIIGRALQGIELFGKDGGPIDFRNQSDDELRRIAEAASATSASGASEAGAGTTTSS